MAYTTQSFIEKANKIHENKYDYSKTVYQNGSVPVIITCPLHGDFMIRPYSHLQGCGCYYCGIEQSRKKNTKTTEWFIDKARQVHGDTYDYSKVVYKKYQEKVKIICKKHGVFEQRPENHIKGAGCPECAKEKHEEIKQYYKDNFLQNCRDKGYDVSSITYVNASSMLSAICDKHGKINVLPNYYLKNGCPYCKKENSINEEKNKFITKAKEKYGDKYDYSKVIFKTWGTPVEIICKQHGSFYQKPVKHLHNSCCRYCLLEEYTIWTYEKCYNIAKKYKTLREFKKNEKQCYHAASRNGWLHDFKWLYNVPQEILEEIKTQSIYVYEFSDGFAYVGLTCNMRERDKAHRRPFYEKKQIKYGGVLQHSLSNNIDIPPYKILESELTLNESKVREQYWMDYYKKEGWHLINKVKGGSLGGKMTNIELNKELIIAAAEECGNIETMMKKHRSEYNGMIKMGLKYECFPKLKNYKKPKLPYEYTEDFILEIVKKYPIKNDLRKNETAVYQWLYSHNKLYDYYEKPPKKYEKIFRTRHFSK